MIINYINIILVLASSGIDYDIKLWAPVGEEPFFDEVKAKEVQLSVLIDDCL